MSATYQYQAGGTTLTGVNRPLSAVVGAPAGVMVIEGSLSRDAVGRVRFFGVASALGSLSPTNDDGNLTFDGRCHYEWDGESSRGTEARWTDDKVGCPEGVRARAERPNQNRLIGMEEAASHSIFGTGVSSGFARANRLEFAYDALGRRVRKKVLDAPRNALGERSGAWVLKKETVFVWQDWRMLAEYVKTPEITTLQLRRSYLWGMDLVSGVYEAGMAENAAALNPAGGVGGLLWVVDYLPVADYVPGQPVVSNRQLAPWYDGNGNILGWVENELAQVQPLHRLEYDAFGRLLVDDPVRVALTKKQNDLGATEAWLDRPAFGFSTKYEDGETGLLYYGHRYYAPEVGRWVSRDPIEEAGGINLFGFVGNNPTSRIDVLGNDPADYNSPIWHHRIPKKLEEFVRSVTDVNAAGNGWILEEADHRTLNNIYDQAWDAFVERNQGKEITMNMVKDELTRIESRFQGVLARGEQAMVNYSQWGRLRPQIMQAKRKVKVAATMKAARRTAGKLARVIVVFTVVQAYHSARASGYSEIDALNQAGGEVINITPWSVEEMVNTYQNNSNWEYILEKSMEAHTRGNNLFDGFSDPNSSSSRSYMMRELLSECQ